jgi:tRNA pseudouridine55 synthase
MLGCGGCMEKLLRTKVGVFELQDTLKLSEIDVLAKEGVVEEKIISVDALFADYPSFSTAEAFDVVVHNGNRVEKRMFAEKPCAKEERLRVYDSKGEFIGIYEYSPERKDYKPVKMFYENIG